MVAMTASRRQDWQAARTRILQRMAELRLTPTDVIRASGLSDKHVRTLLNEHDVSAPRESTRWALCDALQWTPNSIDLILEGGEPVEVSRDESGEVSLLADLAGRLAEIEAMSTTSLEALRTQQGELAKFWRLHQRLEDEVRAADDDLRERLQRLETAAQELRRGRRPGDVDSP